MSIPNMVNAVQRVREGIGAACMNETALTAPVPQISSVAFAVRRHRVVLLRCLFIIVSIAVLELASRLAWIDPVSFIPPSEMAFSAWKLLLDGTYRADMLMTLSSAALAIVLATTMGFLFGLLPLGRASCR